MKNGWQNSKPARSGWDGPEQNASDPSASQSDDLVSRKLRTKIVDDPEGPLVLTRSLSNYPLGIFLFVWVSGWTFGMISLFMDSRPDLLTKDSLFLWIMLAADLVGFSWLVYAWTGKERLTISSRVIAWEAIALIRFMHSVIPTQNVTTVDLQALDTNDTRDRAVGMLVIEGPGTEIYYGEGLDGVELHYLLEIVRSRLSGERTITLEPIQGASQVQPVTSEQVEEEAEQNKSTPRKALDWIMVPVYIFFGFLFMMGGIGAIRSGNVIGIAIGLLLVCAGFAMLAGKSLAIIVVLKGWLTGNKPPTE